MLDVYSFLYVSCYLICLVVSVWCRIVLCKEHKGSNHIVGMNKYKIKTSKLLLYICSFKVADLSVNIFIMTYRLFYNGAFKHVGQSNQLYIIA